MNLSHISILAKKAGSWVYRGPAEVGNLLFKKKREKEWILTGNYQSFPQYLVRTTWIE